MSTPRLILASGSPRRQSLLCEAGYDFVVHPADIDESAVPEEMLPSELAEFLARAKALAVAGLFPNDVVLAADTVVAFGDRVLGKPADAKEAYQMLELLSGTTHIVITGVAVRHVAAEVSQSVRVMSAVHMRSLTQAEVKGYVASNEWQGKAGGYGIQDADPFVTCMTGSHTNIVGLPMEATRKLLSEAGIVPGKKQVEKSSDEAGKDLR